MSAILERIRLIIAERLAAAKALIAGSAYAPEPTPAPTPEVTP
jgi:hypothetical protein